MDALKIAVIAAILASLWAAVGMLTVKVFFYCMFNGCS